MTKMSGSDGFVEKGLSGFPEHLLGKDGMKAVRKKFEQLGCDFAPCGVDGQNRLIVCADDGTVTAHDLKNTAAEHTRYGWRLETESKVIGHRQHPEEYMLHRDTSEWLWVHPQWRYLTAGSNIEPETNK